MQLTEIATQRVILNLLSNQDYRAEVLSLINTQFMDYAIDFLVAWQRPNCVIAPLTGIGTSASL